MLPNADATKYSDTCFSIFFQITFAQTMLLFFESIVVLVLWHADSPHSVLNQWRRRVGGRRRAGSIDIDVAGNTTNNTTTTTADADVCSATDGPMDNEGFEMKSVDTSGKEARKKSTNSLKNEESERDEFKLADSLKVHGEKALIF